MSIQTLWNLGFAKTPEDKDIALAAHLADRRIQLTDAQHVENFLSQCVGMDGQPFAPADIKNCAAQVEADVQAQEAKRGRGLFR